MISIESVVIKEFRGIRDITLNLGGENFAVCGPNGTGKSGVVDALEFVLTGNVSRLKGEGRGEVSLREHGPHVDMKNSPDQARVIATIKIHGITQILTIERSLSSPANLVVNPPNPAAIAILKKLETHPEVVLSRRELIRYVLATPGKRAEEVQSLLHLDQIEKVRGIFQKIANNCSKQLPTLKAALDQHRSQLIKVIGAPELTKEKVLEAANIRRALLGIPALTDLTRTSSLKDGLAVQAPLKAQRIPKTQAIADIKSAREAIIEISNDAQTTKVSEILKDLETLNNDPVILKSVKRNALYTTGLELIEAEMCPLCDKVWDMVELKKLVNAKISHLKQVSLRCKDVENKIAPLIMIARRLQGSISTLIEYSSLALPPLSANNLRSYVSNNKITISTLTAFPSIAETMTALANFRIVPQAVLTEIDALEKLVNSLPEPSKQDEARDWLAVTQERLEVFSEASQKFKTANLQVQKTQKISDIYAKTSDSILTGIYAAVEGDFESLYAFIHRGDEDSFEAKLTPSIGKLGFDVNFYGRGFFPPGAYHSEGHQDSMGLCLYLALMRHLHGKAFTFCILDDVLMSVDANHRRQVCALLQQKFPDTQFIMTTHDPIWLRHMRTEKLINGRAAVFFRSWNVEHGPTRWDEGDVWTEIDGYLKTNEIRLASSLLRHYLEYISGELCHRLRAPVEFRGDAQYQLGELLPAAIKRMRDLLKRSKEAANSWGYQDVVQQIGVIESKFSDLAAASRTEDWQINVAIHYNSWDNLSRGDFEPVVKAFSDLIRGFTCKDCGELLFVSPDRESPQALRCNCGKIILNIVKK